MKSEKIKHVDFEFKSKVKYRYILENLDKSKEEL